MTLDSQPAAKQQIERSKAKNKSAKPPKVWPFVCAALTAVFLVAVYAYLGWSRIDSVPFLPKWIQNDIAWVTVEATASADADKVAAKQEDDKRTKLLDLRGKLGDSFGPLNALLSSFGFIALLYSINLQRAISAEQARIQQDAINKQQFAATQQERIQQRQRFEELFSLTVAANRSALNEITWQLWARDSAWTPTASETRMFGEDASRLRPLIPSSTLVGKKALSAIWLNEVEEHFKERASMLTEHNALAKEVTAQYAILDNPPSQADLDNSGNVFRLVDLAFDQSDWPTRGHVFNFVVVDTYRKMYRENEYQLDAYFRTLYRIFELVSRGETDYGLSDKQVREYAAIARAQLGWHEMALVLLNCCAYPYEKAGKLYSRYALFDNLTDRRSIVTTLLRKFVTAPKAIAEAETMSKSNVFSGLTPAAFNSDDARKTFGMGS
jgi:hypothetical protein